MMWLLIALMLVGAVFGFVNRVYGGGWERWFDD